MPLSIMLINKILAKTESQFQHADTQKALAYFIPPAGSTDIRSSVHQSVFDLTSVIKENFLDTDSSDAVLLLTGASGSGKTLLTQHLLTSYIKNYKNLFSNLSNLYDKRLPLWIPLTSLKVPASTYMLMEHLVENLGLTLTEYQEFRDNIPPLLIVCDGYDEAYIDKNLFCESEFDKHDIKIIITCKSEGLPSAYPAIIEQFAPSPASHKRLLQYHMMPFNAIRYEAYIRFVVEQSQPDLESIRKSDQKTIAETGEITSLVKSDLPIEKIKQPWKAETYLYYLKRLPELDQLIRNPYILSLAVEVLPDMVRQYICKVDTTEELILTRHAIYRRIMNTIFLRKKEKLLQNKRLISIVQDIEAKYKTDIVCIFKEFTEDLAKDMFDKKLTCIHYDDVDLKMNIWRKKHFNDANNSLFRWILSACPLKSIGPNKYEFLHHSIIDFYAAEYFFNGSLIRSWIASGTNLNSRSLVDEYDVLKFLADRVQTDLDFKDILFEVIQASKYEPSVWKAAANAITILNYAGINFNNKDFKGIRIGGEEEEIAKESVYQLSSHALTGLIFNRVGQSGHQLFHAISFCLKQDVTDLRNVVADYLDEHITELWHYRKALRNSFAYTHKYKKLLKGLANKEYTFSEEKVLPNGDCGFIAIGANRESVVEALRPLASDPAVREQLKIEVKEAFETEQLTTEEMRSLSQERDEQQLLMDDRYRMLREQYRIWQPEIDQSQNEQITSFMAWLETNGFETDSQALLEQRLVLFKAEDRLNLYYERQETVEYYINALSDRLWLGYQSALLYAKVKGFSLFIWRKDETDDDFQLTLIDSYQTVSSNQIFHILHTDGFTHFNILVESEYESVLNPLPANTDIYLPFKQYIEDIRYGKEWGDEVELILIQQVLNKPIVVINSEKNPSILGKTESLINEPIFIHYNKKMGHYSALILEENVQANEVLIRIKNEIAQKKLVIYTPKNCWGADLRGALMTNAALQGSDLRNVNLLGATLTGTNLAASCVDNIKFNEVLTYNGFYAEFLPSANQENYYLTLVSLSITLMTKIKFIIQQYTEENILLLTQEIITNKSILNFIKNTPTSIKFNPAGDKMAVGFMDGIVYVYLWRENQRIIKFSTNQECVYAFSFSPTQQYLALVVNSGDVYNINLDEGIGHHITKGNSSKTVCYSSDGATLTIGTENEVQIVNLASKRSVKGLIGHTDWPKCLVFNPENIFELASGGYDKKIKIWNIDTKECRLTMSGHTDYISALSFNRNGTQLASGGFDYTIRLWELVNGNCIIILPSHRFHIRSVYFHPNGKQLLSADMAQESKVKLWNLTSFIDERKNITTNVKDWIMNIAWRNDNKQFACAVRNGTILIHDTHDIRNVRSYQFETYLGIWSICYLEDSEDLLIGMADGTLLLWNPQSEKIIKSSKFESVLEFPDMPEENVTMLGNMNAAINMLTSMRVPMVTSLCQLSKEPLILAVGMGNGSIHIWNVTNNEKQTLQRHSSLVTSLHKLSDTELVSGSWDGKVIIWNIPTARPNKSINVNTFVSSIEILQGRATLLIGCANGNILQWNYIERKYPNNMQVLIKHSDSVNRIKYIQEQEYILAYDNSNYVSLWDLSGNCLLFSRISLDQSTRCSHFSNDHNLFVVGNDNGDVTVFSFDLRLGSIRCEIIYNSSPWFSCENVCIGETTGLLPYQYLILKQHGVFGNPSARTSSQVIKDRSAPIRIRNKINVSWLLTQEGRQYSMTENNWILSMVRKRSEDGVEISSKKQHVYLLMQGIVEGKDHQFYSLIKTFDFFVEEGRPWLEILFSDPNLDKIQSVQQFRRYHLIVKNDQYVIGYCNFSGDYLTHSLPQNHSIRSYFLRNPNTLNENIIREREILDIFDKEIRALGGFVFSIPKLGFFSTVKKAFVQIRDKSPKDLQEESTNLISRTIGITKEQGEKLLANVTQSQSQELGYSIVGKYSILSGDQHNCVSWSEEQIRSILDPERANIFLASNWKDFIVCYPDEHLPAEEGQLPARANRECSIM